MLPHKPSLGSQLSCLRSSPAFSLVELTLALGLVSFCLVGIMGLLPVGLKSASNSREQASAANAVMNIATGLRNATSSDRALYTAVLGGVPLTYTIGPSLPKDYTFVASGSGAIAGMDQADIRMKAHVIVTPPVNLATPGQAEITVAWPASAEWQNGAWAKSEGNIKTAIQFLPRQ